MKKRHTPEQIIRKLRDADQKLADGTPIPEVARQLEISEATYHRWRNQYGGMKADAMKRLKEFEKENSRLKKIVADQAVDISILKEVSGGNFQAQPGEGRLSRTFDGNSRKSPSVGRVGRLVSRGRASDTSVAGRIGGTAGWLGGWLNSLGRTPATATEGCGRC